EIIKVAEKYKNIHFEAFWDEKGMPEKFLALPNLVFNQVNEPLFLNKMANCQGLMTTAGFESVGEAMYLGKKVLMVPVKGQYEQQCNALDAVNSGAGVQSSFFDLAPLKTLIENQRSPLSQVNEFKIWQNTLETHLDTLLDSEEKTT
ncbi:MAG: glycosyltransferase family protein, partial [Cyclobacteriaceae bacterium]